MAIYMVNNKVCIIPENTVIVLDSKEKVLSLKVDDICIIPKCSQFIFQVEQKEFRKHIYLTTLDSRPFEYNGTYNELSYDFYNSFIKHFRDKKSLNTQFTRKELWDKIENNSFSIN